MFSHHDEDMHYLQRRNQTLAWEKSKAFLHLVWTIKFCSWNGQIIHFLHFFFLNTQGSPDLDDPLLAK